MESYMVRLSSKGQLTLPGELRRKLNLDKGAKLFVVLDKDEIRMKVLRENGEVPVLSRSSSFFNLIGSFKGAQDLSEGHDSYLAEGDEE